MSLALDLFLPVLVSCYYCMADKWQGPLHFLALLVNQCYLVPRMLRLLQPFCISQPPQQ
jgi:hypothetical protein